MSYIVSPLRSSVSPNRIATTQERSADSSGCPMPRSVAMDSAAISSARRTPESVARERILGLARDRLRLLEVGVRSCPAHPGLLKPPHVAFRYIAVIYSPAI